MRSFVAALVTAAIVMVTANPSQAGTAGSASTSLDGIKTEASRNEPAPTSVKQGPTIPQLVCTYTTIEDSPTAVVTTQDGYEPIYDSTHSSTEGAWQFKQCEGVNGISTLVSIWVPKADPIAIAQQAISTQSLPSPEIATNPSLPTGAVVNFPTWLWINPAGWRPVTATAAVDGFSVTATASPESVTWNTGDGKSITCSGPGAVYDATKPDAAQHSDCTHSYSVGSANQPNRAYSVTATVQWQTTWQASDGTIGQLPVMTRTSTTSVPVREIQSINVAPPGGW